MKAERKQDSGFLEVHCRKRIEVPIVPHYLHVNVKTLGGQVYEGTLLVAHFGDQVKELRARANTEPWVFDSLKRLFFIEPFEVLGYGKHRRRALVVLARLTVVSKVNLARPEEIHSRGVFCRDVTQGK